MGMRFIGSWGSREVRRGMGGVVVMVGSEKERGRLR